MNLLYFSVISTNPDVLVELGKEEVSLFVHYVVVNSYISKFSLGVKMYLMVNSPLPPN